jgi:uncharacterized protein (TIGR03437 family)
VRISRPFPVANRLTRRGFGSVLTGGALGTLYTPKAGADTVPWTVVIVPDPQYLATPGHVPCQSYEHLIQWALQNRNLVVNGSPLNIKGFIQVGDCQDASLALKANSQEDVMVRAWSAPTAQNMFVAFCCGNHDYENAAITDRSKIGHAWRSDTGGAWSPENLAGRYAGGIDLGSGDYAVWGGIYDDPLYPRSSANNFIRLQVGGRKILIIALEFFPRSAVLNWARAVHDQYFDHEVWATTHGYMDTLGRRCDRSGYGPGTYKLADAPTSNSGEQMWAGSDTSWAGFTRWPRLGLVTCGHWINGGWDWQRKEDIGAAGQITQQIFCNTQVADSRNPCSGTTPDGIADIAHLMLLRIWPTSCEAFMVSTNTGKWTGGPGVRNSALPIQLFSASLQPVPASARGIVVRGISNSSNGQIRIGSGSWMSIYGENLSTSTRQWAAADFAGLNLPTSLDGVSVKINGRPAAVYYVSPGQLNVQAPTDVPVGQVTVEVTNASGRATATATIQTYAPGFFAIGGRYAAAVHTDGAYVAPSGFLGQAAASRPAKTGDTLMIFGTGFGPTTPAVPAGQVLTSPAPLANPAQLIVLIGGVPAKVQWAGLVVPGEYQINVIVPSVPNGEHSIMASIGGVSTVEGITVPVQN